MSEQLIKAKVRLWDVTKAFLAAGGMSWTAQQRGHPTSDPLYEFTFSGCTRELMIGWETDNAGIEASVCFHVYFIDLFAF